MRILFIAPYVPSRIRIRPFQIIKGLAARHEVHVLVLGGSDKQDTEGVDEIMSAAASFRVIPHSKLRGYAQSLLALPTHHPMCTAFCWSKSMSNAVVQEMACTHYDLVHVEHLRAAHFAPVGQHTPVLFDAVDCLAGLFSQMATRRKNPLAKLVMREEAWKLSRYEPRVVKRFGRVIVTSDSESNALKALDDSLRVEVVANGVDTDYFAPTGIDKRAHRIVFSGKMSYQPNAQAAIWFAEQVFPGLKRRWPDAEFLIVGSSPSPAVCKLEAVPGVAVTGYVDDIRPHLASASVAVVPMQIAAGIQNKVLEAMSMSLPVVVSSAAARALGNDCPGLMVADTADGVADAIGQLFEDPDGARIKGQEGRSAVIAKFSWEHSINTLEETYRALLSESS